uniref:BLTX164 n=1 Tax=Nephila pilipes TaxID=299642 RepID=A0A076KZL1_NEPPI|nr:BLTX164 [Nephila pilipes]
MEMVSLVQLNCATS